MVQCTRRKAQLGSAARRAGTALPAAQEPRLSQSSLGAVSELLGPYSTQHVAARQAVAAFMWSVLAHLPLCRRAPGRSDPWRSMAPHLCGRGQAGQLSAL